MNEQEIFETTATEETNYEVNDNFELDTFDYEGSDGKDDILKYVGVAAAAIGAFALIERGVKAIGKKIKSKKHAETEEKPKKTKEEVIDVEEEELEEVAIVEEETEKEQSKKK